MIAEEGPEGRQSPSGARGRQSKAREGIVSGNS